MEAGNVDDVQEIAAIPETIPESEFIDGTPATVSDVEEIAADTADEIESVISEEIENSGDTQWQKVNLTIANLTAQLSATLEAVNHQQSTTLEIMNSAAMNYNLLTNQITELTTNLLTHSKELEPATEPTAAAAATVDALESPIAETTTPAPGEAKPRKVWI